MRTRDRADHFWDEHHGRHTAEPPTTPREAAAELALDPAEGSIERADIPRRQATGPEGRTATVVDHVLVIRRAEARR